MFDHGVDLKEAILERLCSILNTRIINFGLLELRRKEVLSIVLLSHW